MAKIVLIIHDVRSALNVGSLLRTSDGLGVDQVFLTGYTPYPAAPDDARLPHIAAKVSQRIVKSALGAEKSVSWQHVDTLGPLLSDLKKRGYEIAALEQSLSSVKINEYQTPQKVALLVGSEIGGLDKKWLDMADVILQIPMFGKKESFNVAVAGALALYHLTFLG